MQFSFIFTANPRHVPAMRKYISDCINSLSATNLSKSLMAKRVVLSRNPYKVLVLMSHVYIFYLSSRFTCCVSLSSDISPSLKLFCIIFFFRSISMLYLSAYLLYFRPVWFTKFIWSKWLLLSRSIRLICSYALCYCASSLTNYSYSLYSSDKIPAISWSNDISLFCNIFLMF